MKKFVIMHSQLLIRMALLMLYAVLVGSCRQKTLSDEEEVLRAVRKDSGTKSSYETTKNLLKITFPDFVAPSYNEYIDSATVVVSNDTAYVLCVMDHESKNVLPEKPNFPYKSRRSDFFVLEKRDGRWDIISTTYYSERGVPASFFENHRFYGGGNVGYKSSPFTNDIYYYIAEVTEPKFELKFYR